MLPPLETFPDHPPLCISLSKRSVGGSALVSPAAVLHCKAGSHEEDLMTKSLKMGTVKKAESLSQILQGHQGDWKHCTGLLTHALL